MKKELEELLLKQKQLINKINEDAGVADNNSLIIFIGALSQLMFSKKLFKKNVDLAKFLQDNFDIEFAEYAKKSRPIMMGQTIKHFFSDNSIDELEELNLLYSFILKAIDGKTDEVTWADLIKSIKL